MKIRRYIVSLFSFLLGLSQVLAATAAKAQVVDLLDAFWHGQAHFEQVGDLDWAHPPYHSPTESSGWITVANGNWYLFSRMAPPGPKPSYCPAGYWQVVVRVSSDQGKTWSSPALAARPQPAGAADSCSVVDGSSYYDADANVWHMLTQCAAANNVGGWGMCHYTRAGVSPLGPFVPDPANPVIRSGELWDRICEGPGKACRPGLTKDEGTPDIIAKRGPYYYFTFHGWDPQDDKAFRGEAKTSDFHHFITDAPDLPSDALFSSANCQSANPGCVGAGASTTIFAGDYQYTIAEMPNRTLLCKPDQNWFELMFRAPANIVPSWRSGWQPYPRNPVLIPSWNAPGDKCNIQYARLFIDRGSLFLIYEDFGPHRGFVERRLLKLVSGPGPAAVLARKPSEPAFDHSMR